MAHIAPAVIFTTPFGALATLIGAASIPIVIHLLSRRRYRIVEWAAMRFLLAARRQNVRRLRIEQLLLLAIRTSLLILLVVAMASVMPWAEAFWQRILPSGAIASPTIAGRTHKVIVIDGSLSMTLRDERGTCFDRAKTLAAELVQSSAAGDGYSVVLMAAPPQAVVAGPADDARKVISEIESLRCTHGNADLPGMLQLIEELIRKAPGKYAQREIYFVTDMQRSTWLPPSTPGGAWTEPWGRLQAQTQLVVLDVGRPDVDNLSVTSLAIADPLAIVGTRTILTATVQDFSAKGRSNAKVDLLVGRPGSGNSALQVVQQELATLPAGGSTTVAFPFQFMEPGDYVFQVRVDRDELAADDSRLLTVTARETVPVLIVDGKSSTERYERAGTWLADALFPFSDSNRRPNYPARPKVIDLAKFADAGASDLSAYECIFLCDVPRLSEREVSRLETHLQRGGGVVVSLGPGVDLEAYNRQLFRTGQGLLPVKFLGIEQAPKDGFFTLAASEDAFQRTPLAAFAGDDERASLLAARLKQYVRIEAPAGSPVRRVLSVVPSLTAKSPRDEGRLATPGGDPLVLEWPRHRGRVILVTSTLNTDWTSWPISPSFPPFMQELFRFAMLQPPRRTVTVGETIEELLPPSIVATDGIVRAPDGRSETISLRAEQNATRLQFKDADQCGIYRVTLGSPARELTFAVNPPTSAMTSSESDLRRLSANELRALTPEEDVQIASSVGGIRRIPKRSSSPLESAAGAEPTPTSVHGPGLARWMLLGLFALLIVEALLAWRFGAARSGPASALDTPHITVWRRLTNVLLTTVAFVSLAVCLIGGALLIHAVWSDNFLGFLPLAARQWIETAIGVPPAGPGEGTRWRVEFSPYLSGRTSTDRWLITSLAIFAIAYAVLIYRRELARPRRRMLNALPLIGLRSALALVTLAVLLPQTRLLFEREGWPDLALIIDESRSMSHVDDYQDSAVRAKADELARDSDLPAGQRLALAQALITRSDAAWLDALLARQARLHVFRCSSRVEKIGEFDAHNDRETAVNIVRSLRPNGSSSALGTAVRTVLQEFRGSSLAGVVMFTDGVTTEGDDLVQSAQQAAKAGVPIYFVGVGDAHEPRDLVLHDLQVEDVVHVQDRLVFDVRLTAKGGLQARTVPVTLSERQDDQLKLLAREEVALDPNGRPVRVRLMHTPSSPGERDYVLEVPVQNDESDPANNRLERPIYVAEFQRTRVLYIEGYPRYEYRFLKTLLERESATNLANKTIDLKVLLADADPDYAKLDRSAIEAFPATREELFKQFDLVILGDVDPRHAKLGEKQLQWLAEFVREKGGGLLAISGEQFMPHAYRDTPLADVLPIEVPSGAASDKRERLESFRVQLTPTGRMHPMFRFVPDEADNQVIWDRLAPVYWSAGANKTKPAAEVLAVRPSVGAGLPQPVIVQQFVGLGRAMYFGFDESWRWRIREDEGRYNQFWVQAVRFLARSRLGRIELRTDRQTPYRQGESIRLTVRFPDDAPPPAADVQVQITAELNSANGDIETQTLNLVKLEGSRASYESVLTRTTAGNYKFWLSLPAVGGIRPQAAAKVLLPPGEMDQLRMNRSDLERAALISRGRFYSLTDAERLPEELPPLPRVTLDQPRPPWNLWNHPAIFALAVTLLSTEWLLRKRQQLL